jgi:hypothetical protein
MVKSFSPLLQFFTGGGQVVMNIGKAGIQIPGFLVAVNGFLGRARLI